MVGLPARHVSFRGGGLKVAHSAAEKLRCGRKPAPPGGGGGDAASDIEAGKDAGPWDAELPILVF